MAAATASQLDPIPGMQAFAVVVGCREATRDGDTAPIDDTGGMEATGDIEAGSDAAIEAGIEATGVVVAATGVVAAAVVAGA